MYNVTLHDFIILHTTYAKNVLFRLISPLPLCNTQHKYSAEGVLVLGEIDDNMVYRCTLLLHNEQNRIHREYIIRASHKIDEEAELTSRTTRTHSQKLTQQQQIAPAGQFITTQCVQRSEIYVMYCKSRLSLKFAVMFLKIMASEIHDNSLHCLQLLFLTEVGTLFI